MLATSFSSVASQTSQDGVGGCSRTSGTSAAAAAPVDVDAQPSTSATSSTARCHYAAASSSKIVARQVNASAQTQERFLARSGLTGTGGVAGAAAAATAGLGAIAAAAAVAAGGSAGLGNAVVRPRRRVEATRSANSDVIVLEVVVEENGNNNAANAAPAAAASAAGNNNNDAGNLVEPSDFNAEEPWGNCDEENNCSDLEEICTCQNSMLANSRSGSNASLSETLDMDATDGYHQQQQPQSVEESSSSICTVASPFSSQQQQRKRKYNEGRLLDGEYSISATGSAGGGAAGGASTTLGAGNAEAGDNSRKRIAYDFTSTPRSSTQTLGTSASSSVLLSMTPTSSANLGITHGLLGLGSSPALGRRTPRSLMATHDNPPAELQHWLGQFQRWSHAERLVAVDRLIDNCDPSQVRHMMKVIEPQFQRDFISLLPRELALFVLSYLEPKDLLRAAQTCRSWRFLCDDNLLWKEKCRKAQILTESRSDRPKRGRDGNMPPIASPWKAAYMRQHIIEMNWRSRPVRKPKVLKGHDDHVITCLQFSGNRIVSGSDDNTLKVWSAVNGKVSPRRGINTALSGLSWGSILHRLQLNLLQQVS